MNACARILCLVVVLPLAACGGGGSGGASIASPTNLSYSTDDVAVLSGVEMAPLLAFVEGDVDHFSIVPALPAGLVLDPATGMISGAPHAPAARATYDVAATNAGGSAHATVALRVAAASRFAYAAGGDDATIQSFVADAETGRLTRRGYTTAVGVIDPELVVVDPLGRFAYASSASTAAIASFAIDAETGALELAGTVDAGFGPHSIAFDPAGRFVYVASRSSDRVDAFAIDGLTGALARIPVPVPTVEQPSALAVDATGTLLFVATAGTDDIGFDSSIFALRIDATSGALASFGPPQQLNGARPFAIALDPVRDVVYLSLDAFDAVLPLRFTRASGVLTPVALRPTGVDPRGVAVDPRGRFLYVACEGSDRVDVFAIQPSNASLTFERSVAAPAGPVGLALDPLGSTLYATAAASDDVLRFTVDPEGGAPTLEETLALRGTSGALALASGPKPIEWLPSFVHVACSGSEDARAYTIDPSDGSLAVAGEPMLAGGAPVAIAVHPNRRFAWIASALSRELYAAAIDESSGALTAAHPPVSVEGEPTHVALDPAGRFLYLVSSEPNVPGDGWITTFALDATTGAATPIDTRAVGSHPSWVTVDPTGRFVLTAERGDGVGAGTITLSSIALSTGIPFASGGTVAAPGIESLCAHPNGRYVYATSKSSGAVTLYMLDHSTGTLVAVPPGSAAGTEPAVVCVTPDGRFAYGAIEDQTDGGHVAVFGIGADGRLGAPLQEVPFGTNPVDVAVAPGGRFLYVANRGSNDVSTFAIDPATGQLTPRAPIASGTSPRALAASGTTR